MVISYVDNQLKSSENITNIGPGSRIAIKLPQGNMLHLNISMTQETVNIPGAMGNVDGKLVAEILGNAVTLETLFILIQTLQAKYPKLGRPKIEVFVDPTDSSLRFIELVFPRGTWEEWKKISKEIKKELRERGQRELASKVAIICLEGMKE